MDTLRFPVRRADHFMYPAAMFRTPQRPTHGGDDFTPVIVGEPEPMYSIEEGRVVISSYSSQAGHNIMVLGDRTGIRWWYGHASHRAVSVGDRVGLGHYLGMTGNTGNVTGWGGKLPGCHLHLEAHRPNMNDEIDPWPWIWDAPDVTGSVMPLAPTREVALLTYPQYNRPKPEESAEEKEEAELMGAIDKIQEMLDAQTELLSSRNRREARPEVYYIEVGDDGTRYTLDNSPAAALIHPASGFIMPLDPPKDGKRGQVGSLMDNYRIIAEDSVPQGFSERVFYNTIKDVARGSGIIARENDEAKGVAWAKTQFKQG